MLGDTQRDIKPLFNMKRARNSKVKVSLKSQKTMSCVYFNGGSYSYPKRHEINGVYYKHICSAFCAHESKANAHSAIEYRQKS